MKRNSRSVMVAASLCWSMLAGVPQHALSSTAEQPPPAASSSSVPAAPATQPPAADGEPELPRIETPSPGASSPGAAAPEARTPERPPILAWLESQGVTLTALGQEGGLFAYLGEAVGGQMQVFYVTPDGRHIVAGLMFREGGSNVTAEQLAVMRERFSAEQRRIQEQQQRMEAARRVLDGGLDRALTPAPERAPAPAAASSAVAAPSAPSALTAEQIATRDRVVRAAEATAWFSLGRDGAPVVYMLADPQCPYCHSVWAQLRPRVEAGEIQVKIILVGALPGSEERAISILARPEPGRVWFAGEGSSSRPVAPPPAETSRQFQVARRLLQANLEFARALGVRGTPWLAYVGADGALRTVEGATDMSVFLRGIR